MGARKGGNVACIVTRHDTEVMGQISAKHLLSCFTLGSVALDSAHVSPQIFNGSGEARRPKLGQSSQNPATAGHAPSPRTSWERHSNRHHFGTI